MTIPWTLPGAEQQKGDIKVSEQRIPVAEDFDTIRSNLERIKKEKEAASKALDNPPAEQQDDYYGCGYADNYDLDYSCNGTETLYEAMEAMLDENDKILEKYCPTIDNRILELIKEYNLKVINPIHRILPGI